MARYPSRKFSGTNIPVALSHIENTWKKFLPETPYEFTFLDENFDRLYKTEDRQKTLFTMFACIAIFIACLGLFGLAPFIAEQRTKEIGIRKVLGASVQGIVQMLSKDFMKLVAISIFIAAPFAWYVMHKWLQDFAYRINITSGISSRRAGLASLPRLSLLLSVSFQAIRAAITNPVKSLRNGIVL